MIHVESARDQQAKILELGRISEVNKMMNDLYSDCVNIFKVFANVKFIPVRTGKYLTTETLSGNDVQTDPDFFEISDNSKIRQIGSVGYFGISRHGNILKLTKPTGLGFLVLYRISINS